MATISVRPRLVQTKSASPGAWYAYNNAGGGITNPANYSTTNANLISAVRTVVSANRYIGVSEIVPGDPGWLSAPISAAGGSGTILFLIDLTEIAIDGVATSLANIQPGFLIQTLNFKIQTLTSTAGTTRLLRVAEILATISPNPGTQSVIPLDVSGVTSLLLLSSYGLDYSYPANLIGAGQFTQIANGNVGIARGIVLEGTCAFLSFAWNIGNGLPFTIPSTPTQEGKLFGDEKLFTLTSGYPGTGARSGGSSALGNILNIFNSITNPLGTGPSFISASNAGSGVNSVIFSWDDVTLGPQSVEVASADFDEWSSIFISFNLPGTLPTGVIISVFLTSTGFPAIAAPAGTGTQFSGSVLLGKIKILTTEASGIYKIVTDKRNDTMYIDSPTSDDTADVAIPYPHGKTGFIGG